ncbi:MAG TPA: hypothetical protein VF194_15735 [Ferrovibrio sp.]|uniref:hypothetical protein n=1 Tax=Ferrovibrio sp. TaxID=1917215 RepID=UPI002ED3DC99
MRMRTPFVHKQRAAAGLFLTVAGLLILAGCDLLNPPPAAPPPPPVNMVPLPPPVPEGRKPGSVPIPQKKPPVPTATAAAPAPPPPVNPDEVPDVIGLNRDGLTRLFGTPTAEREAPPARVLEFRDGECVLAAYLYLDTARNDFYTLQYEVNGTTERNADTDRCLVRITHDAASR